MASQVQKLKTACNEVLLGEGQYEEKEYNARLAGLMEMLRARGAQPSASVNKLFSSVVTGTNLLERSPERPTNIGGAGAADDLSTPPHEKEDTVRSLRKELGQLRQDMVTKTPGAGSQNEAAEGALAQAITVQTEAIRAAEPAHGRGSGVKA